MKPQIINQSSLRQFIRESIATETEYSENEIKKIWEHLSEIREEITTIKHKLKQL